MFYQLLWTYYLFTIFLIFFPASRAANGHGVDLSAVEMTRLALLKMYGAAPPAAGLPNLPPLPGLPADILQQAQQQQDKALNLHLQRQMEAANEAAKEDRLRSEDDDTKEAVEDEEEEEVLIENKSDGASVQNSLSPPPPSALSAAAAATAAGVHSTGLMHSGSKKRHRSNDSIEAEEVSSPKKPTHNNPLGLPGANIKIASRGM